MNVDPWLKLAEIIPILTRLGGKAILTRLGGNWW